jgi:hypothetical protein
MIARQLRAALALGSLVHDGPLGRHLRRAWAYAAAGYLVAIIVYLVAQVLVNLVFNLSGAGVGTALAFLFGRYMVVACLGLIGCVNLAVRGFDHAADAERPLFVWAISGAALLAPLLVLMCVLGMVGYLVAGGSGGEVVYEVLVQLAGTVVAAAAGAWALSWVVGHQTVVSLHPERAGEAEAGRPATAF